MGKIVELPSVERIKPEGMPVVEHDLGTETGFMAECYKEGYVFEFCPSCGQPMGGQNPYTLFSFECGLCGAKWSCENAKELFDKAYPHAGEGYEDE